MIPKGRVVYTDPPIPLAIEISPTFIDETGEAPQLLGRLLAEGASRVARETGMFVQTGNPGVPLTEATCAVLRLEGRIVAFELFKDYRWWALYGSIVAIPVVGVSAVLLVILLMGLPVYTDREILTVELGLREVATGRLVGTYSGSVDETFVHDIYQIYASMNEADGVATSFFDRPQTFFGVALERAFTKLVQDRWTYQRLARVSE